MFQMITNKLTERTERLYWSCTDLLRLCTKRHFSGDQEGELETLSRMTNRRRPTVHDDFPSSLTSLFFFHCSKSNEDFREATQLYENTVGVNRRHTTHRTKIVICCGSKNSSKLLFSRPAPAYWQLSRRLKYKRAGFYWGDHSKLTSLPEFRLSMLFSFCVIWIYCRWWLMYS